MTLTQDRPSTAARRTTLLGIGVVTACALACSIPLLVGAGVVASGAAFLAGSWAPALAVLAVAGVTVGAALVVRRRATAARSADAASASCACGGACGS